MDSSKLKGSYMKSSPMKKKAKKSLDLAKGKFNMGYKEYNTKGNLDAAIQNYTEGITALNEILADEYDSEYLIGYQMLAILFFEKKQFDRSLESVKYAIEIKKKEGEFKEDLAVLYRYAGDSCRNMDEPKMALEYYGKALEILEKCGSKKYPVAPLYNKISECHKKLNNVEEANKNASKFLDLVDKGEIKDVSTIALLQFDFGILYAKSGEPEKGRDFVNKGLTQLQTKLPDKGVSSPLLAEGYNFLAFIDYLTNDFDGAEKNFNNSLDVVNNITGMNKIWKLKSVILNNLGAAKYRKGLKSDAQNILMEAIKIKEKEMKNSINLAISLNNLSVIFGNEEQWNKASELFENYFKDKAACVGIIANQMNFLNENNEIRKALNLADATIKKLLDLNFSKKHPAILFLIYKKAQLCYVNKDYKKTIEICEEIISIEPRYKWALVLEGYAKMENNDFYEARDLFQKALQIDYYYGDARVAMIEILDDFEKNKKN